MPLTLIEDFPRISPAVVPPSPHHHNVSSLTRNMSCQEDEPIRRMVVFIVVLSGFSYSFCSLATVYDIIIKPKARNVYIYSISFCPSESHCSSQISVTMSESPLSFFCIFLLPLSLCLLCCLEVHIFSFPPGNFYIAKARSVSRRPSQPACVIHLAYIFNSKG